MSAIKSTGLGRGLDSLIPQSFDPALLLDSDERVQKVLISTIVPNPEQPRRHFDVQALEELASSIKQFGVLQPLIITPHGESEYKIVAGERRWRASQLAGLEKVPAIVRAEKELEQLEIALIENVQRVDLSPIEQAVSIERLHQQFNISYNDIAARLSKAVTTVNNIVRLLQLPKNAREALEKGEITEGHSRAILALKSSPQQQNLLLEEIKSKGWSVRQAEQFVQTHKIGLVEKKEVLKRMATETPATKKLSKRLNVPVTVRRMAKGGRLELHFSDETELDSLMARLQNN